MPRGQRRASVSVTVVGGAPGRESAGRGDGEQRMRHVSGSTAASRSSFDESNGPDRKVSELEALLTRTYQAHQQEAVTYCASILGNRELADDAVQTAFATLLRRIRTGDAAFFAASPWEAVKRNLRWAALKQRRERSVEQWFPVVDPEQPSKDR